MMSNRVIIRLPFRVPTVSGIKSWFVGLKDRIGDWVVNSDWIPWFAAGLSFVLLSFMTAADFQLSRLYAGVLDMPHLVVNGHFTSEGQIAMGVLMIVLIVGVYVWAKMVRRR